MLCISLTSTKWNEMRIPRIFLHTLFFQIIDSIMQFIQIFLRRYRLKKLYSRWKPTTCNTATNPERPLYLSRLCLHRWTIDRGTMRRIALTSLRRNIGRWSIRSVHLLHHMRWRPVVSWGIMRMMRRDHGLRWRCLRWSHRRWSWRRRHWRRLRRWTRHRNSDTIRIIFSVILQEQKYNQPIN